MRDDDGASWAALRPYLWAAAVCGATTLLTHALVPYFDLANIVMVFLLAVVGVGVWLGRGPAVLAAFVNVGGLRLLLRAAAPDLCGGRTHSTC